MNDQELKDWIETTFKTFLEIGYTKINDNETNAYKEAFEQYLLDNNIDYDVELEFDYVTFINKNYSKG
jgi:hypothetical protein